MDYIHRCKFFLLFTILLAPPQPMISKLSPLVYWPPLPRVYFQRPMLLLNVILVPRKKNATICWKPWGWMEELSSSTVPAAIRHSFDLDLKPAMTESEATACLKTMAGKNKVMKNFIGMGYYGTLTASN